MGRLGVNQYGRGGLLPGPDRQHRKEITADQGRLVMEDMILVDVVGWDVPANYSPIGTVDVMQIGQLAQT